MSFDEDLAASRPSVEERWIGTLALEEGMNDQKDQDDQDDQDQDQEREEGEEMQEEEAEQGEETGIRHDGDKIYEIDGRTAAAAKSSSSLKKMKIWLQHAFYAIAQKRRTPGLQKTPYYDDRDGT